MAASTTKVSAHSALPRAARDAVGWGGYSSGQEGLQNRTEAGARGYVYPMVFGELPVDIVLFPPGSEHHCVMEGTWILEIAL